MKVKDCVLLAAKHIGKFEAVEAYVKENDDNGKQDGELLLDCFNTVENELALDYLPLYKEDELYSDVGQISFSNFSESAVRILGVWDQWGNSLPYRLFPAYIKTQAGKVRVRFTYTPKTKTMDDDSDFMLHASERMIAYGMAAEYCIEKGLFEEAAVWDEKYKDAIKAACCGQRGKRLRSRRWV